MNRSRKNHRGGMALLLVIPAVALAAVLSYAVLANVGTQDQISANSLSLAQADCMAESGINYAMYQLQQSVTSQNVPPAVSFTSTTSLGTVQESFTVVSSATSGANPVVYSITSTGTVTNLGSSNNPITRQITVNVQIPLVSSGKGSGGGAGIHSGHGGTHSGGTVNGTITGPTGSNQNVEVPQDVQAMTWSQ